MSIEARLGELEAECEVRNLLNRRSHAIDYGDPVAFGECYTEDVEYETRFPEDLEAALPNRGGVQVGNTQRFIGREAMENIVRNGHTPDSRFKHLTTNIVIDLSLETGTGTAVSYGVLLDRDGRGVPYLASSQRCLDTLRRCEDGRWRIATRITEVESLDVRTN